MQQTKTRSAEKTQEDNKKIKLSTDPNKAIEEMMITIDELRQTLIEETKILDDADSIRFMEFQDKKLKNARAYMNGMQQLISRKEEIRQADPTLKQRLEEKRAEFAEITHHNYAALQRMQHGIKRLGDRIIENARVAVRREKEIIYGSRGQMHLGKKASMGINESV